MLEKALAGKVKTWAKARGIFYRRIENLAGEGDPDVYMGIRGKHVWLELKTGTTLRVSQINWMHIARRSGVPFIALRMNNKGECKLLDELGLQGEYPTLDSALSQVWDKWLS